LRQSDTNTLKYKIMNSVEKSALAGGLLQGGLVTVIEPWFIRKENHPEANFMTGPSSPVRVDSFVEYYY
jgi:hypothetical protein